MNMNPEMIENVERMCRRMVGNIAARQVCTLFRLYGYTEINCTSLKEKLIESPVPGKVEFTVEISLLHYHAPGELKKYQLVAYGFFDWRVDPVVTRITRLSDGAEVWAADGDNNIGKIELD